MKMITLANGAEEAVSLVVSTMISIETLLEEKPIVLYELVMKCHDNNHQFFGDCGDDLKSLGLVQSNGSVHESIQNVVLSATRINDMDISVGSPAKQQ